MDMYLEKYDLVMIKWIDATSSSVWGEYDAPVKLIECIELGIVWSITDDAVQLTTGWNEDHALSNRSTIPRVNIKEVILLQPAEYFLSMFEV